MKTNDIDGVCRWRASKRHGVVGRKWLLGRGVTVGQIDARVRSGMLVPVYPGAYILGGVPLVFEGRLVAALEWAGEVAAVSLRACAALFRLEGGRELIEITGTKKMRKVPEGIIYHWTRALPRGDVTSVGCIRTTTVTRMLIEIGEMIDEESLEVMLDQALRDRRTTVP